MRALPAWHIFLSQWLSVPLAAYLWVISLQTSGFWCMHNLISPCLEKGLAKVISQDLTSWCAFYGKIYDHWILMSFGSQKNFLCIFNSSGTLQYLHPRLSESVLILMMSTQTRTSYYICIISTQPSQDREIAVTAQFYINFFCINHKAEMPG